MVLSLIILLVIVGATLWLNRGCQFSPNGPAVDPSALPSVDASRELSSAARRVDYPVRSPAVPAGWYANSANTVPVGTGADASTAVRVGWVTPNGTYLRLSQSKAQIEPLVVLEAGGGVSATANGTMDVAGTKWTKYPGKGGEPSWVTSLGNVQVLITGSGSEDEFRALATAVQDARPVTQ
ncbi:uncharacterized protein DUF4245 [Actinocrispum wychmicini]|uniref:Uncharacterized protein DUF4245 n=2 Tax=Actinocrispum wychmicini TaxID=1213861 RepID=A0A4R2JIG3_9PSEU|nr:uncharacterized protein DUF4245 [Actinocrispum wychmicini]